MKASSLPPRLYEYKGKRRSTYYTITPANEYINLGNDATVAKRRLLELEEGRSIAGTIGELLDDYLEEVRKLVQQGKRSPRTLADNDAEATNLKRAFGRMDPTSLQPHHVWKYLHKARGKTAPVRANREIALLQSAFNFARDQGIVRDNPCVRVKRNEEAPRERHVDDQEFYAFLIFARANGHIGDDSIAKTIAKERNDTGKRLALAAELSYLTGKAQGQILRLHKTQIGEAGIQFEKRKRGAATLVQWTPRLTRVIEECAAVPSTIASTFVIYNRHGQPYSVQGFKALWNRLQVAWEKAGNARFTFHDLRAKAVTTLIEKGRKASELTGHRTEQIPAKVYDRRRVRKTPAVE